MRWICGPIKRPPVAVRPWLIGALLCLSLLLGACGAAPASLIVVDEAAALDQEQLRAAANPLVERGATVVVIATGRGDQSGADFSRRLAAVNQAGDGQIAGGAIAIYVSFEPRYSELRAGERWSALLPGARLRHIRQQVLNPALRDGDAPGGLAATLAALDAEIRAGFFGVGRDWAIVLGLALLLLIVTGVVALAPLRAGLGRIGDAWLRSAPGRALAALWARTPPGRRRIARQVAAARQRLETAHAAAHAAAQQGPGLPAGLADELGRADKRRAGLEQRPADDSALPGELDALAVELRRLATAIESAARAVRSREAALRASASQARQTIERLAGAFQRAAAPPKHQRKPAPAPAAAAQLRLVELQAQLAALDQRRVAAQSAVDGDTRIEQLRQLIRAYDELERAAGELWRAELPRSYRAATGTTGARPFSSTSSPAGSSSSPGGSASSSASNNWDVDTGSSGPSSDGGPW